MPSVITHGWLVHVHQRKYHITYWNSGWSGMLRYTQVSSGKSPVTGPKPEYLVNYWSGIHTKVYILELWRSGAVRALLVYMPDLNTWWLNCQVCMCRLHSGVYGDQVPCTPTLGAIDSNPPLFVPQNTWQSSYQVYACKVHSACQ